MKGAPMLQSMTWFATDKLARSQFQMFSQLGEEMRLSKDDQRRVLLLSPQEWADWSEFRRGRRVAGATATPGDAAAVWAAPATASRYWQTGEVHRHSSPAGESCYVARGVGPGGRMRAIFVQIKCEMGQAYKVAREAADTIEQMSELYSTSGQYDLLGKFYLEPEQDIGLFVTEKIQTLPGVKDTYTLITFNAFSGGRA